MKNLTSAGKPVHDKASKICVLFDPKDGRVVHVHGTTILDSGEGVGATEMEARARRHAEHFGKSTTGLRALHVPITAIRGHEVFRVNESGDLLAPVPRPKRQIRNR